MGLRSDHAEYWVATDRYDLSAEQITLIYKLRWEIEKFFGWRKPHLNVYHLIARSAYGFMVQMVAGLIT
ncbi:MAG: transposase [Deltaproteobacteria bacterium]|nr:transposase [Deltaproteobacteria bacterium]MBW1951862.1 transposase [Deltaproteobacteria bacterium]MBW1986558.1 transposase [Deltaproteobacteria bacterium]MBW2134512.1 transposase [Deltaproteobacteria bacterium]